MTDKTNYQPFEVGAINRLIHDPTRLMLISFLFVVDSADFVFLQSQTKLTAGNISSHMSKLENAGYVEVKKGYLGKRPQTIFRLTGKGRAEFDEYRKAINGALFQQTSLTNDRQQEEG